jgi:hypothetical protein
MPVRKNPMTPLAAVVASLLAGAAGTVCLDAVHSLKYHRAGGTDSSLAWDLSAHLAYGAGTGTTFWLLSRIVLAASACWPTVSGEDRSGQVSPDRVRPRARGLGKPPRSMGVPELFAAEIRMALRSLR